MELIKAREIRLTRKGEQVVAVLGFDLKADCRAGDASVQEALRNFAAEIDRREISVWVPGAAKQYAEDGVLKASCPECGAVHEMSDFARVIAFVRRVQGRRRCGFGIARLHLPPGAPQQIEHRISGRIRRITGCPSLSTEIRERVARRLFRPDARRASALHSGIFGDSSIFFRINSSKAIPIRVKPEVDGSGTGVITTGPAWNPGCWLGPTQP
jgi:hypothetical protein